MIRTSTHCHSVRRAVLLPAALVVSLLNNLKASWAVLAFIAVLYGPVLWLTVLLHELGHCLATKRVRLPPSPRSRFLASCSSCRNGPAL